MEKHMSTCKAAKSKLSLGNWIAESAQGFRRKSETKPNQRSFICEISPDSPRPTSGTLCFMLQLSLVPTSIGTITIMCYNHLCMCQFHLSCPFWKAETMSFFSFVSLVPSMLPVPWWSINCYEMMKALLHFDQ